jgi:hypothetical protein
VPKIHSDDKWWKKGPTVAGDGSNATQRRLAEADNFTGISKQLWDSNNKTYMNDEGDYCVQPMRARNMLINHSYKELTIPGRAGDFKNEVEWRLNFRR